MNISYIDNIIINMDNSNLNNELIIYLKEKIKMINEDLLIVKISDDNNIHYVLREFSEIVYNFPDNLCESFTAKFKKSDKFYTLRPYDIFNEVSGYNSYQKNYTFTCFQSIRFNVRELKIVKDFWIKIIIMFYQFRKRECSKSTPNLNRIVDDFEKDTAKIINNFQRFTRFMKKRKRKKLKKPTSESTKKTTSSVAEILLNLGGSSNNHHQLNDSVNKKSQTSLNSISSSDKSNKDLSQKVVRECLSYILDCVEKNNPQKSNVISRKDESICETKKKSKAITIDCTSDSKSSSSVHSLIDLTHETQEKEKGNELVILQQGKEKSAVCQKPEESVSSSSKSLEVLSKKRKSLIEINSSETKKIKMVELNIIDIKKSVDLSRSMFIELSKTSRDLKLKNQKISEQVDEISVKNTELETQISDREKVLKCQESFRKILDNKFSMIEGKTKNLSLFGNELVNNGSLQVCKMCKSVPSSEAGYMVAIPCGHVDICKNCFSIAQPKHCIHDNCSCSLISYIRLNI